MPSVVQNLLKAGYSATEGVPFIPFVLTWKMDNSTRRAICRTPCVWNPKMPVTIDEIDQYQYSSSTILPTAVVKLPAKDSHGIF